MRFNNINELMNHRMAAARTQDVAGDCPMIHLFGVVTRLNEPVIRFTKMSKKYLYDADGNKYTYKFGYDSSDDWSLAVFTTESEAWRFFKDKTLERMTFVEDFFNREMRIIKNAERIISDKAKEFPEYFV